MGHASSDMGRPLEGPKSSEGAGPARLGWEWEAVSAEVCPEMATWLGEPGEQAERSRGEVEGREVKVKTWV